MSLGKAARKPILAILAAASASCSVAQNQSESIASNVDKCWNVDGPGDGGLYELDLVGLYFPKAGISVRSPQCPGVVADMYFGRDGALDRFYSWENSREDPLEISAFKLRAYAKIEGSERPDRMRIEVIRVLELTSLSKEQTDVLLGTK